MPSIPESWKTSLENSRMPSLFDALREGDGRLDVSALARAWVQRLARLGLREVEPSSGAAPKEPRSWNPHVDPFDDDTSVARVGDSRRTLLLRPNGPRSEFGYRIVEVLEDLP